MPLPIILVGIAALSSVIGLGKGIEAINKNAQAKDIIQEAQCIYDRAKEKLDEQNEMTSTDLRDLGETKLSCWSITIGKFVKQFRLFKKVDVEHRPKYETNAFEKYEVLDLKEMSKNSAKAEELIKGGIGALGAGAIAGIASYSGVMMFASASTGTAIASLSGVAASNATLAWLGGGSLAAGGMGMAGGVVMIGGLVLGPALGVTGMLMDAKSNRNLAQARATYQEAICAAEKMCSVVTALQAISILAHSFSNFICEFSEKINRLHPMVQQVYEVESYQQRYSFTNIFRRIFRKPLKVDYRRISRNSKKLLHLYYLSAQLLNKTLATALIDSQGKPREEALQTLEAAKTQAALILN